MLLVGGAAGAADSGNRRMTQSRSRRIVLFLDGCYAGAFDRGMRARATKAMDLEERFGGRGRAVLTASGALESALEGGWLTESGEPDPALFPPAVGPGQRSHTPRGVAVGIGEQVEGVGVMVDRAYSISGRVVKKGKPTDGIPGVTLGAFSIAAKAFGLALEPSAADDAFEIVGLPPASYIVGAIRESPVPEIGKNVETHDKGADGLRVRPSAGVPPVTVSPNSQRTRPSGSRLLEEPSPPAQSPSSPSNRLDHPAASRGSAPQASGSGARVGGAATTPGVRAASPAGSRGRALTARAAFTPASRPCPAASS